MADPLAGITGSVNAGLKPTKKQPKFPGGLDQHFGLGPGIKGSVNAGASAAPPRAPAPAAKPAPNLGGITGHVLAPKVSAPSITGSINAGLKPVSKVTYPGREAMVRLNKTLGDIRNEEGKINTFLKGGPNALQRQERIGARMQSIRERNAAPKQYKAGGLLGIVTNPAATLFGPNEIGNIVGGAEREAINIPTQVIPAGFQSIKASVNAVKGHPAEATKMGKEFGEHSVIGAAMKGIYEGAVHGNASGAVKSFEKIPGIAKEHPVATGLEVTGTLGAVDRGLGAIADRTGARANMMDSGGASLSGPSRAGRELIPGGATKAQPAYSKGLLRQKLEKYVEGRPLSEAARKRGLGKHFDAFQGQMRRIVTMGREAVKVAGNKRVKGLRPGEEDLITPFGKWLPHPDVKAENGDPLWRQMVSEKIERLNRMTPNSHEQNNPLPIEARDAQIHYLQRLLEDRNLQENGGTRAIAAAEDMARAKGKLKGELSETHFTPEEMRIAEMKPAFHEYYHDQQPHVETSVPVGESPFSVATGERQRSLPNARASISPSGRRTIPVDEVDRVLHEKGFRREQRFFTSDSPNRTEAEAYRGGYSPGGQKTSKGTLTGNNFIRGQSDLTYPHAVAQHAYEQLLVNIAHGDREMVDNYFHDKEAAAKLIDAKLNDPIIGPGMRQFYENHANSLRHEHGTQFWEERNGRGPAERAAETKQILEKLYPDRKFEVAHIARPFATAKYRGAIAPKMHEDISDRMDYTQHAESPEDQVSLFPQIKEGDAGIHAGRVGLVDRVVADKMRAYDSMVKKVSLSQAASNFWRRTNIAFSVRHPIGVAKEMGYRMGAANIGVMSALTARRALPYLREHAEQSKDPKVKLGMKRLEAYIRGTVAAYSDDLRRRISIEDLYSKPRTYAVAKALTGNKITGNTLKLVQGLIKGKGKFPGYEGVTQALLNFNRRMIEHPPQVAGLGRHYRDEFKALTGKSLKVMGKYSDLEKEFYAGRLNRASVDHTVHAFREYWGEWNRADPTTRKVMVLMPFYQWYINSLRFIYHTMPVHHPEKTAVLVILEAATEEQRKAEGQGYQGGFPLGTRLNPGELEPSQQGSIPFGKFTGGEPARGGEEYYSPPGAISGGLDTALNALLPYSLSPIMHAAGYDPLTKKLVEEENPETGKKEPVTDQNKLFSDAALELLSSFVPPVRYAQQITKGGTPEKLEDPVTRLLMKFGLPASVAHALRPIRTEHTYTTKVPGETKGGGLSGVGGLGGGLGGLK